MVLTFDRAGDNPAWGILAQPRCEPVFDGIATVADALMSVVLAVVEFTPTSREGQRIDFRF